MKRTFGTLCAASFSAYIAFYATCGTIVGASQIVTLESNALESLFMLLMVLLPLVVAWWVGNKVEQYFCGKHKK